MIFNVLVLAASLVGAGLAVRELIPTRPPGSCSLCQRELPAGSSWCVDDPDVCMETLKGVLLETAKVEEQRARDLTIQIHGELDYASVVGIVNRANARRTARITARHVAA